MHNREYAANRFTIPEVFGQLLTRVTSYVSNGKDLRDVISTILHMLSKLKSSINESLLSHIFANRRVPHLQEKTTLARCIHFRKTDELQNFPANDIEAQQGRVQYGYVT